ncbi:MAG: ABC transporter permease subunit [Opitutaceae bacterium]
MSADSTHAVAVSWPRRAGATALILLCWLPVAYLALLSLARDWAFPALLPPSLTLATWQRALTGNDGLVTSFATSAVIALLVATLATAAGVVASRVFAYHRRRGWWVLAMHAPFALSPVILGTCLLYFFIQLGLVGSVGGVIAAQFIFAYAYAVIVLIGFWNPHVAALEDLARTLGARRRQVFRHVLFPLVRPLLAVAFFQTFLLSWFDYGLAAVIGAGKVPVLTLRVTEYMGSGNVHLAAACALLLIVPPLALLLVNRRLATASA